MKTDPDRPRPSSSAPLPAEATVDLLNRARQGDEAAVSQLLERCIPALQRWARGHVPVAAHGMLETTDLVHQAAMAAIRGLADFEPRHQGDLQAFLRQAVLHRIRDLFRKHERRPDQTAIPADLTEGRLSPLDEVIGSENIARYEAAIEHLRPDDRAAIIGRIELQQEYDELAVVLDEPSASAARMAVTRAMKHLAEEMRHAG